MTGLLREIWGTLLKVQRRGLQGSRDAVQLLDLLQKSEALRHFPNLMLFFDIARVTAFLEWKKRHRINEGFFANAKAFIEFVDWLNESVTMDSFDELCVASREEYRNFLRHVLDYSDDQALPTARFSDISHETAFDFLRAHYPEDLRDGLHLEQVRRHDPALIAELEKVSSGFGAEAYFTSKAEFDNRVARAVKMVLDVSLVPDRDINHPPDEDRAVLGRHTAALIPLVLGPGIYATAGREAHLPPTIPAAERPRWSDKSSRAGRNALQFLMDVWGDEISAGRLTSPGLRQADPELYKDFQVFKSKNKDKVTFALPKKQELVSEEIEAVGSLDSDKLSAKDYARLSMAKLRRSRKL